MNLMKLNSKPIATNKAFDLKFTPIICRQCVFILLQVSIPKCSSSEVKILTTIKFSERLYNRKPYFCVDFNEFHKKFPLSTTDCLQMEAWTANKVVDFKFSCNFKTIICDLILKKLMCNPIPRLANFKFLDSKNKNAETKTFVRTLCRYQFSFKT